MLLVKKLGGSDVIITAGSHLVSMICNAPLFLECQVCVLHISCACTLTTRGLVVYMDEAECRTGIEIGGVNMAMVHTFNLTVPDGSLVSLTIKRSISFYKPH